MQDREAFQTGMEQIEQLIGTLDRAADPAMRAAAKDLVAALMEVHGACMAKMLEVLQAAGEPGEKVIRSYADHPMIRSLLILYDLHPDGLNARVGRAVEKLRSSPATSAAKIELLGTEDGVVRIRVAGESRGCGSGGLKAKVEAAILEAAPDASGIFVEDASQSAGSFVPLSSLSGVGTAAAREAEGSPSRT